MKRVGIVVHCGLWLGAVGCGGQVTYDDQPGSGAGSFAETVPEAGGALGGRGGVATGGAPVTGGVTGGAGAVLGGALATGGASGGAGAASGGVLATGGASATGPASGGSSGTGAADTGGVSVVGVERRDCGPLIDDMEDGTGHVCDDGVRRGVWYAFNDEGAEQWPAPRTPGVPIPTAEIPGGRGESRRAMHTWGGTFTGWGAGIGVDLAFDGATYGLYDASAYDGVTFWVRGELGHTFELRVSDEATTHQDYGGTCSREPCVANTLDVGYGAEWTHVWVSFDRLDDRSDSLDLSRLTNLQFFVRDEPPFDFWIDDLAFYRGEPGCCAERTPECRGLLPIEDPNLAAALGQPTCLDTCDDTILELDSDSVTAPITSLAGLHCYAALADLRVAEQVLTEVGELAAMPQLGAVDLADNELANIDGLASPSHLDEVDVSGNLVTSLAPLRSTHGLTVLRAADNLLIDVAGLEDHTGLVELDLSNNQLGTIDALPTLGHLVRLDLSSNSISEIGVLQGATDLNHLDLSSNQISDVTALGGAVLLTDLDLSDNRIEGLVGLGGQSALDRLDLANNELSRVDALATLTGLIELDISGNHVSRVDALAGLHFLQRVRLADNAIQDLSPLAGLGFLSLDASQNLIERIPLFSLDFLRDLSLAGNLITDLSPLAGKRAIAVLILDDNPLSDLSALSTIPWLFELSLRRTAITTLRDLVANQDLRSRSATYGGTVTPVVHLEGNPQLDCAAEAGNIAELRARGVDVFTDCPIE
ncbi:MAG: leucine-rich repeat domain-containing protein [Polyangiaceae bacterium]|nr:leucine-rich repeat domain-containing protein [Polyangiaceae bacterium]